VLAVRRSFETALLPSSQTVVPHETCSATAPNREALITKLPRHARAPIGAVRQGEGRTDMRKQHHILPLPPAGETGSPGEIATLADIKHPAKSLDREVLLRRSMSSNLIDFPPWRKKPWWVQLVDAIWLIS
jgi:hypothetical protein